LEYREERSDCKQHQPIKKHIPLKLKSSNSQSNINVKLNLPQMKQTITHQQQNQNISKPVVDFSHETTNIDDYSQNRPFSDLNTDFSTKRSHAIEKLNWNMNTNTISQKIVDQTMDFCMICNLPILIYGRLIPCKHVMCIQCANSIDLKVCLKESCNEIIERIDTALRGGIFVCNYNLDYKNIPNNLDKFRLNPDLSQKKLCGRSYMSQRDLNSHIQHRHEAANSITYTM